MKIYGIGVLLSPGTNRVIHNFDNGEYETVNPIILKAAVKQGFSFEPLLDDFKLETSEPIKGDKIEGMKPVIKPSPKNRKARR